jgi:hypothetical protein
MTTKTPVIGCAGTRGFDRQQEQHPGEGFNLGLEAHEASPAVLAVDEVDHMQRVPRGSRDHLGGQPDGR